MMPDETDQQFIVRMIGKYDRYIKVGETFDRNLDLADWRRIRELLQRVLGLIEA